MRQGPQHYITRTGEPASPRYHAGLGAKGARPRGAAHSSALGRWRDNDTQTCLQRHSWPGARNANSRFSGPLSGCPWSHFRSGHSADCGDGTGTRPPARPEAGRCGLPEALHVLSGREGKLAKRPAMTLLLKSGFDKWCRWLAVRSTWLGTPPWLTEGTGTGAVTAWPSGRLSKHDTNQ